MQLFGRSNWLIPRWLDRVLPHVAVDVPDAAPTLLPAEDELAELTSFER
jgi:RND superfamily putative drug exporter